MVTQVTARSEETISPPLTAGKLADGAAQQVIKLQQLRQFLQPLPERFPTDAVQCRPALEIFPHRKLRIQHRALEHDSEAALDAVGVRVQVGAADGNAAAVFGQLAADDVDGGGFARAIDAEEGEQLALFDAEAEVLHRSHFPEAFAEGLDFHDVVHTLFLPGRFFPLSRSDIRE